MRQVLQPRGERVERRGGEPVALETAGEQDEALRRRQAGPGQAGERAGLAAGMAMNILPCIGLCVFAVLVARMKEE